MQQTNDILRRISFSFGGFCKLRGVEDGDVLLAQGLKQVEIAGSPSRDSLKRLNEVMMINTGV